MTDAEFYRSALEMIAGCRIECSENINREALLRELARDGLQLQPVCIEAARTELVRVQHKF